MSIQNLAIVFAQTLWSDETRWWEYGRTWKWGNGRRSVPEQVDYPAIFFSLDPLFIFAAFTGGGDNITILL